MSDNRITTVNITILSSLAREVFPDAVMGGTQNFQSRSFQGRGELYTAVTIREVAS
jgi:hypothetical protein